MSDNQTIDGVSRKSLEQALKLAAVFDDGGDGSDAESARGVVWILRALLDAPACSACNDTGRMHEPGCEPGACTACLEKPAAQPQGEPVAMTLQQRITWMMCFNADLYEDWLGDNIPEDELPAWLTEEGVPGSLPGSQLSKVLSHELQYAKSRLAEQPAAVAAVPDGYCIMPRQLTAENGAKALLLGEFKLLVTKECPECCELEEPVEGCSICDGEGEYGQKHTIPWDQIKFIYSKAVSGLAMKAESAKT
ncbi:hypothetical protein [Pseudomonas sp. WS 5413]|uniref:hypothetical protein n=1 Tax=Pseudomonas sp. WS 5413 TaxID=2717488 RepID=UPI001475FFF8|nr:hypothetical protein [Pseudomonas sp. WS 5413]NMX31177.1 hypothetical protein [Pseudomonas sp. WS 5413]